MIADHGSTLLAGAHPGVARDLGDADDPSRKKSAADSKYQEIGEVEEGWRVGE